MNKEQVQALTTALNLISAIYKKLIEIDYLGREATGEVTDDIESEIMTKYSEAINCVKLNININDDPTEALKNFVRYLHSLIDYQEYLTFYSAMDELSETFDKILTPFEEIFKFNNTSGYSIFWELNQWLEDLEG
jgi:Asp-tRNA(Asn)/Glu-tRNA(Gln) amidotransferase C subunit